MPEFSRRRARERQFEEAVRRRILPEPAEAGLLESPPANLAELIRRLAQDLKRRGIEAYEIRTSGAGLIVLGTEDGRARQERYSRRELEQLIGEQEG